MAVKTIGFGIVGPAGNQVGWRAILDNDMLGAGDSTTFHVELTRPPGNPPLPAPGVTVTVTRTAGPVTIDPPGPIVGVDTGNQLAAGETKTVDFQITNPPAGPSPATCTLNCVIAYTGGAFPGVFTVP